MEIMSKVSTLIHNVISNIDEHGVIKSSMTPPFYNPTEFFLIFILLLNDYIGSLV